MVAEDIFMLLASNEESSSSSSSSSSPQGPCRSSDTVVTVSFFELYGGRCQDLLNDRHR